MLPMSPNIVLPMSPVCTHDAALFRRRHVAGYESDIMMSHSKALRAKYDSVLLKWCT